MAPLIWLLSMALHLASSGVSLLQQDHGETCPAVQNQLLWALENCHAFNGEDMLVDSSCACAWPTLRTQIAEILQDWSRKQCLSVM